MQISKADRTKFMRPDLTRRSMSRLTAAIALATGGSAFGAFPTYIGPNNGNWNSISNWSNNALPTTDDVAEMGSFTPSRGSSAITLTFNATNLSGTGLGEFYMDSANSGLNDLILNGSGGDFICNTEFIGNTHQQNEITQSAGNNDVSTLVLGQGVGGGGLYSLSGTGVVNASDIQVGGSSGYGNFNQISGTVTCLSMEIATAPSAPESIYTMTGGNLNMNNGSAMSVGAAGNGYMLQSAGTVTFNGVGTGPGGALQLEDFENAVGTGTYALSGTGVITGESQLDIGEYSQATFVQSGGTHTMGSNSVIMIGLGAEGTNSPGSYVLTGGTLTQPSGVVYVGNMSAGTFNQGGGTYNLGSASMYIGYGASGTYLLSAGNLNPTSVNLYVGYNATGTFNQSGGSNFINLNSALYLGYNSSGSGTYLLSNGNLTLTIGNETVGYAGAGVFTQSGGNNTISNFFSGLTVGGQNGTGVYNLQAGNLSTAYLNVEVGNGTGTFNQTGGVVTVTNTLAVGARGSYYLTAGTTNTATLTVGNSNGVNGTVFVGGTGVLNVSGGVTVLPGSSLVLNPGAKMNLLAHGSTYTADAISFLFIGGNATLDLSNNALDLQSASLTNITTYIRAGFNVAGGGKWDGINITSSTAANNTTHLTAIGVIQNNQSGTALYTSGHPFDGVTPNAGDILVKYTYFGDANLDGKVDGTDYSRIDSAYNTGLSGWFNGDFNYDGVINGSDYTLIDNAFNTQGTSLTAELATSTAEIAGSASVPEPAMLGMVLLPLALVTRRRRTMRSGNLVCE